MEPKQFGLRFNYNRHHLPGEPAVPKGGTVGIENGNHSKNDALERAALLRAEREQRLLAETLAEVTLTLTSQMSREAVLNEILRQMQRLIPYRAAHIMLVQDEELRAASWQGYQDFNSEEMISKLVQRLADFPFDDKVVKTRQPLFIADTHTASDWVIQPETAWVRSHMVVPICLGERVLALLRLDSDNPNAFSTDHLKRLQPLANAAAIALENARLYAQAQQEVAERQRAEQETRQRNRELSLLNRIIAASATALEPDSFLELVCRELALAFDVPKTTALRLDESGTWLEVVAGCAAGGQSIPLGATIPLADNPLLEYFCQNQYPLVIDQAELLAHRLPPEFWLGQQNNVSLVLLPLLVEETMGGLLCLSTPPSREFSTGELDLAWSVADQVAGTLARVRLVQQSQQLTTAIEQSAESVIMTDAIGKIIYVNPKFSQVTGYERAEVLGKQVDDLFRGENHKMDEVWAMLRSGEVWRGRFVNLKKDGTPFTEEATISPIRNEQGEVINYVSLQRDVTRELKLEEQYRQAQKMEAVGMLAGGLAHDFNNLLTAINGFAELAQIRMAQDDPVRELIGKILHSGKRAADLIRQVLIFSRKQMIEPKVLNLNEVVSDLTKMLSRLIEEHIELETVLEADLWPIKADPTQLEQVIVNLVVNARDAMPNGGQLTLETTNILLDEAYLADHVEVRAGDYVLLTVSDTGVGMGEELKTHIFEPFFTTKEKGKGTGLGLATVFGIVEQCEGFIWVYSEPGQGTTFKIYLPRTLEANRADVEYKAPHELPQGTETVLVVEDNDAVRSWTASLLRHQGYTIFEAANGAEALQLLDQHQDEVQLLLTDMIMPQMGGTALVDQLKQLELKIKILFTSGYTDHAVVSNGLLAPGNAFIQKPFSGMDLALKVRQVLDS